MKNRLKHLLCGVSALCMAGSLVFASPSGISTVQAATTDSTFHSTDGTIHFLTLNHNTDAILIECDGKFGMVDSGEDNDYPDGSDPRYPLRAGITKGLGFENQVISYLTSKGVTEDNFEFYIGTHPHSDHIGSADEIIRAFHPNVSIWNLIQTAISLIPHICGITSTFMIALLPLPRRPEQHSFSILIRMHHSILRQSQ